MKKILSILAFILLGAVLVYWLFDRRSATRDIFSPVPGDAVFIFQTERFTDTWDEIHRLNIWQQLIRTPGFEDWQETDSLLTAYLLENDVVGALFKNRPVLMSVHVTAPDGFALLYVMDLKSIRSVKQLTNWLGERLSAKYGLYERKAGDYTYYKYTGLDEPFYFAFRDNLLIGSFELSLLLKSLKENTDKSAFKQSLSAYRHEVAGGLVRWWVNYKTLPDFMEIYFENAREYTVPPARQLVLTATALDHNENLIEARGFTLPDTVPSYFTALLDVKPGEPRGYEITSRRTALYLSQSFKSFNVFHESLWDAYGQTDKKAKEEYWRNIRKIEKYFKIDLRRDFFDWIGNEIALVKLRLYKPQQPDEVILLIHARDPDRAKEGLRHISDQIRKKSPFKFKSYTYKNFEINYLHQKGLFKTLLGNMFKQIDKPYYTFVENYVVFSNSPAELEHFIDDYIIGNTLSHDEGFMDFIRHGNAKKHAWVYVNLPKMYVLIRDWLTGEGRQAWEEKKDFILSMHRISLQLTGDDTRFDTYLAVDHNPEARKQEEAEALAYMIDETVHNRYYEDLQFKIFFPDTVQVKDGPYKEWYPGGKIKVEGVIKNGKPHGFWRTYYPSGRLESVVYYDDGEVHGDAFFYYDTDPPVKKAEMTFDHDLLDGVYREYYRSGALKAEIPYKKGKPHGEAVYYYPDGKIKAKGKFKKGRKKGMWMFYDRNGRIVSKKRFGRKWV